MTKGKVGSRGRILGDTGESRNKLGEYRYCENRKVQGIMWREYLKIPIKMWENGGWLVGKCWLVVGWLVGDCWVVGWENSR